ncbi:stromal interaction molecule homolog isoform X3 [Mya arenaria]|uniref:stromal interaction molecule homolog isoform X3 n=1 Tax=Mya arenaria TaxID=6604 RepID=UPI0022E6CFFC|nr:stromal interaction molecule homolog isoform X3 [Mya arenaria]
MRLNLTIPLANAKRQCKMFTTVVFKIAVLLTFLVTVQFCSAEEAAQTVSNALDKIPLPNENCPSSDEVCQEDIVNLDAIRTLHKQIDDDESGNIDLDESQEFFKEELQNTDGFERQSIFHGKDDKISVEDLWNAWKRSLVYNWTVEDVVDWLVSSVDMPQYAPLFREKGINGSRLPRVAVNTHHYLSQSLGIRNTVNKKKLSLKAMDVVLFGPSIKPHNYMKDIILTTLLVIAVCGLWFALRQNQHSKEEMKKMMADLDALQKAEDSLQDMNEKLQKAEEVQNVVVQEKKEIETKYKEEIEKAKQRAEELMNERQGSNLEELSRLQLAEQELAELRAALLQAEQELENHWSYGAPAELQQWLQYTFELEQQHFQAKQQAAQRQFGTAKEACEKIRRKRTGVLGTLRIAQGNSIDNIDQRIVQARMALEEIRHDMQERQHRWQTIEGFCGFPIRTNAGLAKLEHALYDDGGSHSRVSMVAPMNVEDADEDFPPHYPAATAMLFNTTSNGGLRPSAMFSAIFTHGEKGLGGSVGELKRRQVSMGSTSSLAKSPSGVLSSHKRESVDSGIALKSLSATSPNGHSMPVAFQLGSHSPTSSPDSPPNGNPPLLLGAPSDEGRFPRSKSLSVMNPAHSAFPGSRVPRPDMLVGHNLQATHKPEMTGMKRTDSDGSLTKRALPKQVTTVGGMGNSSQDDDSLSGTESFDSEGKGKKEKKKLKLIPKFMRRTEL